MPADGQHMQRAWRGACSAIGVVPQALRTDAFETVSSTVQFSPGLIGTARILLLDQPTAGVDVEPRRDMRQTVRGPQATGVTIILTRQDLGAAHFDRADTAKTANRLIRRLQQIGYKVESTPA